MNKNPTVSKYGTFYYIKPGTLHRADGPARIWKNGTLEWWVNGNLHREDGPAIIHSNGEKSWYLMNIHYSKEEWWETISDEMKVKALFNGEGV